MAYTLKPNKTVFIMWRWLWAAIGQFIFFALLYGLIAAFVFASQPKSWPWYAYPWPYILLWLATILWRKIVLGVQFKKAQYIFHDDKIECKGGGIFRDWSTELNIHNVTHVRCVLPWLENKFFGTGNVRIQSAGSGGVEAFLGSIEKPQETYDWFMGVMQKNGFKLKKQKLIQREKPSKLAVVFEAIGGGIAGIFVVGLILLPLLAAMLTNIFIALLGMFVILMVISIFVLVITLRYLDLKRRVYEIYDDTIVYQEGFLTRHYAFIPIENISDAEVNETLVDQIFGLSNVKISCQGAGQEVDFSNIKDGKKMADTIDRIIADRPKKAEKKETKATAKTPAPARKVKADTSFTGEYKPKVSRALTGYFMTLPFAIIIFPLFIPWVIGLAFAAVDASVRKYRVKAQSVEEEYRFMRVNVTEFTNDKITGVIVKESFIDKWFDTVSITFWSIGSGKNIVFKYIKKTDDLIPNILKKFGIDKQQLLYETKPHFGMGAVLARLLPMTLFGSLVILAGIGLIVVHWAFVLVPLCIIALYFPILAYRSYFWKQAVFRCFEDFIFYKTGVFFRKSYYARYDDIKNIETVRYPLVTKGTIKFNVAGESIVQTQQGGASYVTNSFSVPYMQKIDNKDELFDLLFTERPNAQRLQQLEERGFEANNIMSVKPALANTLFGTIIALAIVTIIVGFLVAAAGFPVYILPLLLLDLVIIIWVVVVVKMQSYHIQPYRVVKNKGVFYRHQSSVVFTKIDHLNQSQGAINKMFGNGNITVHTTGSTMSGIAEMMVFNIPRYKEFYQKLQENYK